MEKLIYMDNAATTRVCDEAISAMVPLMNEYYANPSGSYSFSQKCARMMNQARYEIAGMINACPGEIYFNSGGSEGDNQAIKCFIGKNAKKIAVSAIEHHAVINSSKDLESRGVGTEIIPVDERGMVSTSYIRNMKGCSLISVMMANNEVGTIQPIEEIGEIAASKNVIFHSDAVQAFGHIPIDVKKLNVDVMTVSAHKFGGPKGTGFMYVRSGLDFKPLINGGGQEGGKRAGTENTIAIAGMAAAAKTANDNLISRMEYEMKIRDLIIGRLSREIPDSKINGDRTRRLPGNINISFKNVMANALLLYLDDNNICASAASACSKGSVSHVLSAMKVDDDYLRGTIRLTINHENTVEEAMKVCDVIRMGVMMLRKMAG